MMTLPCKSAAAASCKRGSQRQLQHLGAPLTPPHPHLSRLQIYAGNTRPDYNMAFIQDELVYKGKGPVVSARQRANFAYELLTYRSQASNIAAQGRCCMS